MEAGIDRLTYQVTSIPESIDVEYPNLKIDDISSEDWPRRKRKHGGWEYNGNKVGQTIESDAGTKWIITKKEFILKCIQ
jgi:hypothetical protein